MKQKELGKKGEVLVEGFLIEKGYLILDQNYQKREGEIDLVAYDPKQEEIVFIEVKTRKKRNFGYPEEAVTDKKLRKMEVVAQAWLEENEKTEEAWRLDVVALELGKKIQITHLENVSF